MKKITVTIPTGLYNASIEIAKKQGHISKNSTGLSALCRGLLRARCNKEGYTTTYLDSDDESTVPADRNGIVITGEEGAVQLERCPQCGMYFGKGLGHYCIANTTTLEAWVEKKENSNG